ncbi:hypothetical protein E2C01_092038 [Portunus trituberculatus]|uniref:Uncharacterized protein n=1 Tax=Portunus trituberculatus TaxID=210409 RepID=A0A5B7JKJ5_PORTR|nr:hypothetical protein [Portunus trituberculatus]
MERGRESDGAQRTDESGTLSQGMKRVALRMTLPRLSNEAVESDDNTHYFPSEVFLRNARITHGCF